MPTPETCRLYVLPPPGHSIGRLRSGLARVGEVINSGFDGLLSVRFPRDRLGDCAAELAALFTSTELEDSRTMLLDDETEPSLTELMRMEPIARWIAKTKAQYLSELIQGGGLFFHFQPIVHSRAPDSVFAHECLLRGRGKDGEVISPRSLYEDARRAGLLFPLDRAARLAAIQEAVRHDLRGRLFINFNPSSIYEPSTCLRSTVAAVEAAGLPPGRITFEIVECEQVEPSLLTEIVRYYRSAGFRVALDDLGAGYSSLNLLNALRPDYVKLDRELTTEVDHDPYKACIAARLIQMSADLGIETVAEGVETEGELDWLQAQGVDYIQGYFIARPGFPPFELSRTPGSKIDPCPTPSPALRIAE